MKRLSNLEGLFFGFYFEVLDYIVSMAHTCAIGSSRKPMLKTWILGKWLRVMGELPISTW